MVVLSEGPQGWITELHGVHVLDTSVVFPTRVEFTTFVEMVTRTFSVLVGSYSNVY